MNITYASEKQDLETTSKRKEDVENKEDIQNSNNTASPKNDTFNLNESSPKIVINELTEEQVREEQDPEQWIKENILQKNNIVRSVYLSRLGIKSPVLSKKDFDKVNRITKSEVEHQNSPDNDKKLKLENSYFSGGYSLNFLIKSDDEMRKNFIDKLLTMKIIKKDMVKKHQSSKLKYI